MQNNSPGFFFSRHTASRRDNYECVFLFISRGARLDLRNNDGQTPLDVCPNKDCHSAFLLTLNMKLKQHIQSSSGDAEKIVSKYSFLNYFLLTIS